MNISVDFDETYTRDPELWDLFIELAKHRGHEVYCITARPPTKINKDEVYDTIGKRIGKENCLFTDAMAKAKFAYDKGIHIDVWIDDLPSNVDNNKKLFTDFKNSSFPY
jgi:hypothetical protein